MSNDDQAEKEVMEVTNQQHEDTKVSNETTTTDAAQGGEEEKKEIHPRDIPGQSILVRQVTYSCGRDAIEVCGSLSLSISHAYIDAYAHTHTHTYRSTSRSIARYWMYTFR